MLKRLNRSRGTHPTGPTPQIPYGSAILARVRESLADGGARIPVSSAWELVALTLLQEEERDGLPAFRDQNPQSRSEFARAWLSLVVDNDSMPATGQLDRHELQRPRALLASFFFGVADVQREAQQVMSLIDEKFRSGSIGQAELLLGLFETDGTTRRNNDRNLFYEEMIVSFLSERSERLPERAPAPKVGGSGYERLRILTPWAREVAGVHLCVLQKDPQQSGEWAATFAAIGLPEVAGAPSLPVPQWMPLDTGSDGALAAALISHAERVSCDDHALHLLRAIYFVALATGRIGAEETMIECIEWLNTAYNTVATRLLPELHRRCTLDDESINYALGAVASEFLTHRRVGLNGFSHSEIDAAVQSVADRLEDLDYAGVAEGSYDVGALLVDELLGFRPSRAIDSLRLHRVT